MALCDLCNQTLKYCQYESTENRSIHSTYQSFLAAVDQGCCLCRGLHRQIPEEWNQELRRRVATSEQRPGKRRKVDKGLEGVTWYRRDFNNSRYGFMELNLEFIRSNEHSTCPSSELPKNPRQTVYPVKVDPGPWALTSLSTDSEETFKKIKTWLDKCQKEHDARCHLRRNYTDSEWHPTRLVEITSASESNENTNALRCRIVEPKSKAMLQNLRYATLSHRWPQNQQGFQKLTLDTLPLWKSSLPINTLSQTFRDALLVAQRLGVSYLWIDSICIIQDGDDFADWKKESPTMYKVYTNAEFNICASKNNQNEGLFSQRSPSDSQPLHFELPGSPVDEDETDKLADSGHYLIHKETAIEIWDARMNNSPLASRGWVFQEQLLSRANLHFGDHDILFECSEMRASESSGSDQDYEVSWSYYQPFFKAQLPIPAVEECVPVPSEGTSGSEDDNSELSEDNHDDFKHWHDLLGRYTALQLTRSDDRLVALSGVAQYFKNFFSQGECYIAGLWSSRLPTEILWQLTTTASRETWEKRKKKRHHLSFSWASVEGQVENEADSHRFYEDIHPLADLKPIKYRMSPDAMGGIESERQPFAEEIFALPSAPTIEIMLTGFLRPTSVERVGFSTRWNMWPGMKGCRNADFDLMLHPRLDSRSHGSTRLDFEISSSELTTLNESCRVFLMPLVSVGESSEGNYNAPIWFLLLELVETSDRRDMGRFRRIGVHQNDDYKSLGEFLRNDMSSRDSLRKLPCRRYDDASNQHTIFVI